MPAGTSYLPRTWFLSKKTKKIYCYPSRLGGCSGAHFLTADLQSEDLQDATDEINRILDGLKDGHPDLAILDVNGSLLLADVEHGDQSQPEPSDVTRESGEDELRAALSLRPEQHT